MTGKSISFHYHYARQQLMTSLKYCWGSVYHKTTLVRVNKLVHVCFQNHSTSHEKNQQKGKWHSLFSIESIVGKHPLYSSIFLHHQAILPFEFQALDLACPLNPPCQHLCHPSSGFGHGDVRIRKTHLSSNGLLNKSDDV